MGSNEDGGRADTGGCEGWFGRGLTYEEILCWNRSIEPFLKLHTYCLGQRWVWWCGDMSCRDASKRLSWNGERGRKT